MTSIRILAATLAAALISCGGETHRFTGIVGSTADGMLTVDNPVKEITATFSVAGIGGREEIIAGAPVTVEYRGRLDSSPEAVRVDCDATFALAAGRWVMEDPINPASNIGAELRNDYSATSINMSTLKFTRWSLIGDTGRIRLYAMSLGNGTMCEVSYKATISRTGNRPTMEIEGTGWVLRKEE